jgi:hypothetical protein
MSEVESRGMGSLWLKASATWGRIILPKGLHDWGRRAVFLFFACFPDQSTYVTLWQKRQKGSDGNYS